MFPDNLKLSGNSDCNYLSYKELGNSLYDKLKYKEYKLKDFAIGVFVGFLGAVSIFSIMAGLWLRQQKDREVIEYAEKKMAVEELRESYINRDPVEFFEVPGVRGAADNAISDFERRWNEVLFEFRNRPAD